MTIREVLIMQRDGLFPREVTGKLPYLTMTGNERLHVEQHQGVLVCQDDQISLRTVSGPLRITGTELKFSKYSGQEATIEGRIKCVSFQIPGGSV